MAFLKIGIILYWFSPAIEVMLSIPFDGKYTNIIHYGLLFISITAISYYEKFKFNKKVMLFFIMFFLIGSINLLGVSYKRYVLAEIISVAFKIITPLLILSYLNEKKLENMIQTLINSSIYFSTLAILVLLSQRWIFDHYGQIANLVVYNTIPLILGIFNHDRKKILYFTLFLINFIILFFFGSRMPALATFITFFVCLICSQRNKSKKKYLIIILIGFSAFFMLFFVTDIFKVLESILSNFGIYSRTVTRFANELGTISLLDMLESSHRNEIWSLAKDYFIERRGLPGGFAVTRFLTKGSYYYSHNFFWDIILFFGLFAIPITLFFITRMCKIRKRYSYIIFLFFISNLSIALCQSVTGGYFWNLTQWVFSWGMLLFYTGKVQNENQKINS